MSLPLVLRRRPATVVCLVFVSILYFMSFSRDFFAESGRFSTITGTFETGNVLVSSHAPGASTETAKDAQDDHQKPFSSVYWRPGRKMGYQASWTILAELIGEYEVAPEEIEEKVSFPTPLIGVHQIPNPPDFVWWHSYFKKHGRRLGALVQVRDPRAAIASAYDYHVVNCQEMFMRNFMYLKNPPGTNVGIAHSCLAECCAPHALAKVDEVLARNATPPGYRICDFIRDELSFDDAAKAMAVLEYTKTQGSFHILQSMVQQTDKSDVYITRYELMNDAAEIPDEVTRICSFFGLPFDLCQKWTQLLLQNVHTISNHSDKPNLHITNGSTKSDRWTSFFARLSNVTDFLSFMEKTDKSKAGLFFGYNIFDD